MATLTDDEIARVKLELFDHVLSTGAEPYFGTRNMYAVIRDSVESSDTAATTSTTAVTTAGPAVIEVVSATGLAAGYKVQLDCDAQRETVTVRNVSGVNLSVICQKTHSGTYPVEIESPLTIVRGLLYDLATLEQRYASDTWGTAGLKKVDEVEFAEAGGPMVALDRQRSRLRLQLASALGLRALYEQARSGGASRVEVY